MRILVTGAEGFVGAWLIRRLLHAGHSVTGAIRLGGPVSSLLDERERLLVRWVEFDLLAPATLDALARERADGVIHLAAVASGTDARHDPGLAWCVNAAGTARLCEAFAQERRLASADPVLVIASTGEVYGQGQGQPHREEDPLLPCSPYASSKVGAEVAALEVHRRTGLRVIVARAFPHTGPGQSEKYVVPALALRLRTAKRVKAPVIKTGNLDPVRDFLDVRDVVEAYLALLERGAPGTVYNVAGGRGVSLREVLGRMSQLLGVAVIPEHDADLARPNDIVHLVGDASRLEAATGWKPRIPFDRTLQDLLDAQAH